MNIRRISPNWKSLISVTGLTAVLLLVGTGVFQNRFSTALFAVLLFVVNMSSYLVLQWFSSYLSWNRHLILYAGRHLGYCILSALLIFTFADIDHRYLVAYFSAFVVVGTVFSAFDYLLTALQELTVLKQTRVAIPDSEVKDAGLFQIDNTKGRIVFSVSAADILLLEANDNYLTIYYLEEKECKKRIERLSLNHATDMLNEVSDNFLRVHRSFLVNRQYVVAVTGKSQNYHLKLEKMDKEIPVSRRLNIHQIFPGI